MLESLLKLIFPTVKVTKITMSLSDLKMTNVKYSSKTC